MKEKDLCLGLLAAESEAEVQKLIDSLPEMRSSKNWRPLDNRETNFNITSNQASDGGKALTELMTNMVDAILMKHAFLKGIDPKGKNAPTTMHKAVDLLIKPLRGGKLTSLDPNDPWIRDFAQDNLVIGVTGAKSKKVGLPCYTFVDNGEGQSPEKFESTFLSLSTGNKKDIPFVQGKYNMGSSGVLGYCGLKWFKLIVSRRYDAKGYWGFTLMRKRPGNSDSMPIAEYFVLPDGRIPIFQENTLYPFVKSNGKRYDGVHLRTGTIIKLYDYQIGSRFASGFRGSREALNENLVETILPFRILDFRQKPDLKRKGERAEGIDPRGFCGMEFLLLRSHRENDDDVDEDEAFGTGRIAVGTVKSQELGTIEIYVIKLKRELPGWLGNSNNRVFHAVNGQVQFKQTRGYLAQSCGFPALKDRVVVIVNASNLTFAAHNEVWKGDREHVRDTIVGERYKDAVTLQIKNSDALKELQNEVAKEEMNQAAKTQRNELFQKLVDRDRNLAALLTNRDPVITLPSVGGASNGGDSGKDEFEGRFSPTFLRFEGKAKEKGVDCPINRRKPIAARTDAENGYLQRPDVKGRLIIDAAFYMGFTVSEQLNNGRLTLYLDPNREVLSVGEEIVLEIGLQDDAMPHPVTDKVTIRIVEEEKETKLKPPKPIPPDPPPHWGDSKEGKGKPSPTHGLPQYILLTRDGREISGNTTEQWPTDFTEIDGGIIQDLGETGMLYKINYDNVYHLKYRLGTRGDIAKDVVTEKYILGMRILLLGYEHALRSVLEIRKGQLEGMAEYYDEFRRMAARGAASTVLALAENLPKIVDSSSVVSRDVE